MPANRTALRRRGGFVTIYMAFASFTLIPMVGLAIDFSVLYTVKARLQQAVDAAAIGAGSLVQRSTNLSDPTQLATIQDATTRYFNANYPSGYWNSSQVWLYSSVVQDVNKLRTIYVKAGYRVPMLFMRVLRISNSMVAAEAEAKIRFVNMVITVDRSGSVVRAGNGPNITDALRRFVDPDSTIDLDAQGNPIRPIFVDGRDVVGMVTFGTSWKYDYALDTHFQTVSAGHPRIRTAIANVDYNTNNGTNTADGLFHAFRYLEARNELGALNVILLLTDGRPNGFSGSFPVKGTSPCTDKTNKVGVLSAAVDQGWPPPTSGTTNGIRATQWAGIGLDSVTYAANSASCKYLTNGSTFVSTDISSYPATVTPPDDNAAARSFSTQTGVYASPGSSVTSPRAIRYAAFNVADNIATLIRQDTNVRPVIYAIGLNENNGEEPLDADWLARVANDPNWVNSVTGTRVFQAGQTVGKYYNVDASGLEAALQDITAQILRLSR